MKIQEAPLFKKILVVDDDEASACLSTIILSDMHAAKDIEVAQDGYIASQLVDESNCPDIIFLDIHMPKMDGFELLHHCNTLPASHRPGRVIAISGEYEASALHGQPVQFLAKPFDINVLLDMLGGKPN